MEESSNMAETAILYKNVADGLDTVEESTDSIISTMKAFGIESDNTMSIIDKFNAVGNNFAITSAGIGEALQRSASALQSAGNTLDESVALVTAANSVIQNPEQVGTALKTLALRLRGTKTELEAAGEDVDGMAESTSQLQAKLKALTHGKVDVMLDENTFKNTTEILREMSKEWENMTDIEQASALELMGGKRQANILSSIITNFQTVEDVIETSANSEGSAIEENEKYLDSIQGKTDKLTNSMQTLWNNALGSGVVKGFLDLANVLVKIVDTIGLIPTAAGVFVTYKSASKELSQIFDKNNVSLKELKNNLNNYLNTVSSAANAEQSAANAAKQSATANQAQTDAINQNTAAKQTNQTATTGTAQAEQTKTTATETNTAAEQSNTQATEQNTASKQAKTEATVEETASETAEVVASEAGTGANQQQAEAQKQVVVSAENAANATRNAAKADAEETTTSQANAAANKQQADMQKQTNTGAAATGASGFLSKAGAGLKSIAVAGLKGIAVMLAMKAATWAFGKAWDALDKNVINRSKYIKEEAESLKKTFEDTKKTLDSNLATLTTSSDTSKYETLQDEFARLTKGVDEYGNNIYLTSEQYERYKQICDQIVGIQPNIASGYDSATQAIGNNASALENLIELQKIEARQNAQDYVKDDNLETIAENAIEDYKKAVESVDDAKTEINRDIGTLTSYAIDPINSWFEGMQYSEEEIDNTLAQWYQEFKNKYYTNDIFDNSKVTNPTEFLEDLKKFNTFGKDAYGDNFEIFDDSFWFSEVSLEDAFDDLEKAKTNLEKYKKGLVDTLKQVPASMKEYDDLSNSEKSFINKWIEDSGLFDIDENTTATKVLEYKAQIKDFISKITKGDFKTTLANGAEITASDILDSIFSLDPSSMDYAKYTKEFSELLNSLWDAIGGENNNLGFTDKNKLALSLGFDLELDEKNKDQMVKRYAEIKNISEREAMAYFDNLPAVDVQRYLKLDWNVIANEKELKSALASGVEFDITNYTDSISNLSAVISEYQEALTKLDKGSFTMEDFMSLIKKYPDLAKGVDVSSNAFYGLSRNLNKAIKTSTKSFTKDLQNLRNSLVEAGKSTKSIDQLIEAVENMPDDALDNTIDKYTTLADKIQKAQTAQDRLKSSMEENPNEGYETRGEAMDYIKEALGRGEIGSESNVWNVAKKMGFTYDTAKTINENADALAHYIAIRDTWYKKDDNGNYTFEGTKNFLNAVEAAVAKSDTLRDKVKWLYDDSTGTLDIDFNNADWDEIVKILSETDELAGLTSEEFADLMIQVGQFFNIKWGDASDIESYLNTVMKSSDTAAGKLEEITDTVSAFYKQTTGKEIDLGSLTEAGINALDCDDSLKQLLQTYLDLKGQLGDPLNINTTIDEKGIDGLTEIKEIQKAIKKNSDGTTVIDIESLKLLLENAGYTEDAIDKLVKKVQEYNGVVSMTSNDPLGLSSQKASFDTVMSSLDTLGIKYTEVQNKFSGKTLSVNIDSNDLITTLKQNGWDASQISAYLQTLTSGENGLTITVDGQLYMTTEQADAAIKKVEDSNPDTTAKVNLDTSDVDNYVPDDKSAKVYYNADYSNVSTSHAPTKYGTIVYTDKKANGTAHASGTAFKSGSWGAQQSETSLVGEIGPELRVRGSRWEMLGENGAEFTDVKKGDIIFNHKQTESLLKNGYVTGRGKAYASGTSNNNIFDALKLGQLSKYAEKLCKQYEELVNGNVDLRKRPHLSPSYEHDLAMSGGYNSFIGSDGQIYASTSAETVTIGNEKSKYTIDITPVLENGDVLTSDALAEYIDGLVTDGSTQDLLDSDKYNLVIRAVPGEYDEKDWAGFEDKLSKYKDGYLDTLLEMFDLGGEKSIESSGFSSVGLAGVAKDLQNNGSYDGKEVASAIDSTSDGMKNLDSLINQYVTDVLNAKSLADDIGTDLSKIKYGNVDTDNRQILNWDEKSIDKYSDAIESWGMKVDDLVGSYSTLLSGTEEFDGVDIAFTPILQTEDGPQLLDSDTVYTYINGLIDKASENGGQWTNEDLFKLDAEGLEVDGTIIKNLLEDIGDNASKTSQLLHYVGDTGAIANLEGEIESTSSELVATGENANAVQAKLDALNNTNISDKTFTVTTVYQTIGSGLEETARTHGASGRYTKYANGTVHLGNNAYNNGNFGANKTETALVGELGPEMLVRDGKWTTIGDNGAEFVQIKKGDIIFNHKQTEDLLKNGYITSRGRAYASGTAYLTAGGTYNRYVFSGNGGYTKYDVNGNAVGSFGNAASSISSAASDLSDAASDLSDATDQFEEVFDWVEVRLQEIEETLDYLNAQLENAVGYANQNNIIDKMLSVNNNKLTNLQAGLAEYTKYAAKLLEKVPSQYQDAAQNGAIAITEFAGDADEETVNAINDYRDWADKVADLTQQIEELNAEIAELAKKKFDNVSNQFENVTSIIDNQNDKLEAQIDLMEDRGYVAAKKYYESMMVNTKQRSSELEKEKKALQEVLDQQVKLGNIKVGSDAWYEMVNALYEVDAAIVDCTSDLEKYQNAINEIYWDNFDELINRLDYLKDETQGLIDIMDKSDVVTKPEERTYEGGTKGYWTADDVKWTDEGLASLGLYAQQMEIAEYKARQYAEAIDDLQKDYKNGKYSESEYLDKLNELTQAQYDSIQSYYDAQDAIKDLNSARIDSIKEGIEAEISAYEELINKKKEELDTEKDLYDFQKSIAEQQKNISDIQRKLSALSGDNSASAIAKRKKLEQELAEAKADLEESYYDRSVSDRSDALDKELDNFQDEKDAETEKWEKYLDNIEQVVSDSLGLVQSNASGIYDTLTSKAQEYNLTLSDSIMTPWKDGAIAVSDYQTTFDTAMSSTMDQLEAMKMKWQEIIDKMAEAAGVEIKRQQQENNSYTSAKYTPPQPSKPDSKPQETQKTITVGGKINAKGAKIYSYAGGQGYSQYFANDPIYTVLADLGNYVKVRYHKSSSGVTGFFRKSDVKAYAKGSSGVDKDQLAWIDEMGLEEIVLHAGDNGKLSYLSKGSSVIPHDISENLMKLGQLDPQDVLDRNRPAIAPSKSIINNEISINMDIAEVVHVDKVSQDTLPDLAKIVEKQMDSYMTRVNNSLKKFVR